MEQGKCGLPCVSTCYLMPFVSHSSVSTQMINNLQHIFIIPTLYLDFFLIIPTPCLEFLSIFKLLGKNGFSHLYRLQIGTSPPRYSSVNPFYAPSVPGLCRSDEETPLERGRDCRPHSVSAPAPLPAPDKPLPRLEPNVLPGPMRSVSDAAPHAAVCSL